MFARSCLGWGTQKLPTQEARRGYIFIGSGLPMAQCFSTFLFVCLISFS